LMSASANTTQLGCDDSKGRSSPLESFSRNATDPSAPAPSTWKHVLRRVDPNNASLLLRTRADSGAQHLYLGTSMPSGASIPSLTARIFRPACWSRRGAPQSCRTDRNPRFSAAALAPRLPVGSPPSERIGAGRVLVPPDLPPAVARARRRAFQARAASHRTLLLESR
jgi:hypothetical protein